MLIEEEEVKGGGEVNPDALEAVFEEEVLVDEDSPSFRKVDDEEVDEIDIAFQANDEGYW